MGAESGNTVEVHYTGTLDDGSQFDSSKGRDPLQVTLGKGQLIAGFEQALMGMEVGESKSIRIEPEEAYGAHDSGQVQQVPRSQLPETMELSEGMRLQATTPDGQTVALLVTAFDEETVTLDANHPLAGQALNFALEMVSIN